MRIIDTDKEQSLRSVDLYLTVEEARIFHRNLEHLLKDPEAAEHFHINSKDHPRELSCSIFTPRKLAELPYTELERKVLSEK